jgi:hypothetical protein
MAYEGGMSNAINGVSFTNNGTAWTGLNNSTSGNPWSLGANRVNLMYIYCQRRSSMATATYQGYAVNAAQMTQIGRGGGVTFSEYEFQNVYGSWQWNINPLGLSAPNATPSYVNPLFGDLTPPVAARVNGMAHWNAAEIERVFWQKLIEKLRLDVPSQTPPRRAFWCVYLDLGVDYGWMTAYRVRSLNRIGATAVFKGEAGLRCYTVLETERADIDAELVAAVPNAVVVWSQSDDRSWLDLHRILPGSWTLAQEEENLPWLLRATNAMVNSIRPRVQRYSLERRG